MILYPALDLREGRVVRLAQGDYERETRYDADPVVLAKQYARAGAAWLHVVDLDGARGEPAQHRALIGRIVDATGAHVQAGGGVRDEAGLEALFVAGVARVVVGSVAVREPSRVERWLDRYGTERITVAVDVRDGQLPVDGWTRESGVTLYALLDRYVAHGALKHVLCTDIARDGTFAGPNLELYRALVERYPALALQASGGVRDLPDVRAAATTGAAGCIVGKALLEGRIDVERLLDTRGDLWRDGRVAC